MNYLTDDFVYNLTSETDYNGYIAGELPDGIVTINDAPAARSVTVHEQPIMRQVGQTFSSADGTYTFFGLNNHRRYTIMAYDHTENRNSVVVANVSPSIMFPPIAQFMERTQTIPNSVDSEVVIGNIFGDIEPITVTSPDIPIVSFRKNNEFVYATVNIAAIGAIDITIEIKDKRDRTVSGLIPLDVV